MYYKHLYTIRFFFILNITYLLEQLLRKKKIEMQIVNDKYDIFIYAVPQNVYM